MVDNQTPKGSENKLAFSITGLLSKYSHAW